MRHLILFLFATLVFMLATPMSGSAEFVSNEIAVKPPGDSDFNNDFNSVQINLSVFESDSVILFEIIPFNRCDVQSMPSVEYSIYELNTTNHFAVRTKYGMYKGHNITRLHNSYHLTTTKHSTTKHFTTYIQYRTYSGYSMARLCSLIPQINMI